MKHYTLEKAIEKANAEGLGQPQRDVLTFWRGMANAIRMFCGYSPKNWYFPNEKKPTYSETYHKMIAGQNKHIVTDE